MSTSLTIGPIELTHQVQSINIDEQKAIKILETTRSSKNLAVDSGKSSQVATISLLFTDLNDINTNLKKLCILFKTCPIISISNEMISAAWELDFIDEKDQDFSKSSNNFGNSFSFNKTTAIKSTPVALEQLVVSTVPDVINALYVTLTVTRIEIGITGSNSIYYMNEDGYPTYNPSDAFWLNKWIKTLSDNKDSTFIVEKDFGSTLFKYVEKDLIKREFTELKLINPESIKIQSQSCSLRNTFTYHNLAGKGTPSVQYIGSNSRQFSVDIVFDPKGKDDPYSEFMEIKESADARIRDKSKRDRLFGINIDSPVTKILNPIPLKSNVGDGIPLGSEFYVPVNVNSSTTDQPNVKTVRIDFIESNHDFYLDSEIILNEGGSDYDGLKKHFDRIVKEEYEYRLNNGGGKAIDETDNSQQEFLATFWPLESFNRLFTKNDTFGLLNSDTLKAAFLSLEYDVNQDLVRALENSKYVGGQVILPDNQLNLIKRFKIELEQLSILDNVDVTGIEEFSNIYNIVKRYTDRMFSDFITTPESERHIREVALGVTLSFLGDFSSLKSLSLEGGGVIQKLFKSTHRFSKEFTDALFTVIIERKSPPVFATPAFKEDSLYSAFFKLYVSYRKYAKNYPVDKDKTTSTKISDNRKRSLFPDLLLPTYIGLYGDRWKEFAPTYSDLGIINYNPQLKGTNDLQDELAVDENDYVAPSAWFSSPKFKRIPDGLMALVDPLANAMKDPSSTLVISIPFDVKDIDNIEKILKDRTEGQDSNTYKKEELTKIIAQTLIKYKNESPLLFREDMDKLRLASSQKYYDSFLKGDTNKIAVYHTSNGSLVGKRYMSVAGLGAEIYRVASEMQELNVSDKIPRIEQDSIFRSSGSKEFDFIRSLDENSKKCLKSSLDQVPDDHEAYNRFFPACKVYLLEKRGTDLFGDDSIFSVNPVISVDITLDKEDADLAVIRIADPLYLLQKDFFPYGNVQTVKDEKGNVIQKSVLSNLNGNTDKGFMKRYKLAQGRAIMIKMGYDSNPKCLKTVFTGRIAEIDPGEVITIVAQGWKAELINRQVAFSNTNAKHWGVKDLVLQTIVSADPAGFGDFYPQRDTNFILRNLVNSDVQEIAKQVLAIQEGHNTDHGSYSNISDAAVNSIREFFGLSSLDKDNVGLDTRLKNIWYPEIPKMNNLFGIRSFAESGIDYINDGWVVPATPAWDVLKEATRHSWGSIVQVVPYDGEATIFFGQPDQPYYYTRGNSTIRSNYEKRRENYIKNSNEPTDNLINGFLNSDFFSQKSLTNLNFTSPIFNKEQYSRYIETIKRSHINHLIDVVSPYERFTGVFRSELGHVVIRQGIKPSFTLLLELIKDLDFSYTKLVESYNLSDGTTTNLEVKNNAILTVDNSNLPSMALSNLEDYLGQSTIPFLCKLLYGIDESVIYRRWGTVERDFSEIIRGNPEEINKTLQHRLPELFSSNYSLATDLDKIVSIEPSQGAISRIEEIETSIISKNSSNKDIQESLKKSIELISVFKKYLDAYIRSSILSRRDTNVQSNLRTIKDKISIFSNQLKTSSTGQKNKFGIDQTDPFSLESIRKAKLFVYFFSQYIGSSIFAQEQTKNLSIQSPEFPPTMQVFRVHHYIDEDHNIIKNDLVATTRDMWNTVVIEHPAKDALTDKVDGDNNNLYNKQELFSGVKWEYWPKQEVTGVIGLQFHPGLTLANKKVRIFTEPNVQTEPLAAKVAINRLAEGLRKMYRGTILINGKVMKPHDRVVINDNFTQMYGTVGVESVIHHWSSETGWITNFVPEAIADANPGASILQTAALEAIYRKVFAAVDILSDVATLVLIISTLGGALAAAPLEGAASAAVKEAVVAGAEKGLQGATKKAAESKSLPMFKKLFENLKTKAVGLNSKIVGDVGSFGTAPIHYLTKLIKETLGPSLTTYFKLQLGTGLTDQALESLFKFHVVTGFVENAQKAEQLPVIISPVIFNGLPLMAGLEVDDPIWSIYFNNLFWSYKELQAGAAAVLEELGFGKFESFTKVGSK